MAPKRGRAAAALAASSSNSGTCGNNNNANAASATSLSASLPDDGGGNNIINNNVNINVGATTTATAGSDTSAASARQQSYPPIFGPEPLDLSGTAGKGGGGTNAAAAAAAAAAKMNTYISPLLSLGTTVIQGHPKLSEFLNAQSKAMMENAAAAAAMEGQATTAAADAAVVVEDEGCLHCGRKVKGMPKIKVLEEDDDDEKEKDDDGDGDDDDDDDSEANIQVRCDECQSYICNGCHWCHEFQANHEIRVCDRCDAFYCKACDEMDQCDDCGEVVCGSCSTLLSCKFCGGGLCEECATACGRCGIVLCSRDAKFAVDCDTCRLSYCLVCLASGSKDPCVRCGHRPSKRMEQLVHLRLKSIYKAFKSSSNSKNKSDGGDGKSTPSNATMASVAAANAKQQQQQNAQASSSSSHHVRCSQHSSYHGPRRSKHTTLQDMVGDDDEELDGDDDDNDNMMMMGNVLPAKFCHDLEQNFLAEQKKADAAAEALLAELEEEEEANAKKKSKKKKKKERKQAKKGADDTKSSPEDDDEKQREISKEDDDTEKEMSDVESNEQDTSPVEGPPQEMDEEDEDAVKMDPIEKELMEYVDSGYAEGVEDILFRLKGIPGKAVLRKNAKKALKRLRAEMELIMENSEADFEPVPESKSRQSAISSPPKSAAVAKSSATPNKSAHRQSVQSTTASANKNETFVPIASTLVGWVIGKGGQRIRDMMEASGAKIWVDQEKVKGQPTRNVFISGDKDCVEQGVRLVKDVIANAPPPPGSAPSPTTAVNTAAAAAPNLSAAVEGGDLKAATKQAWESAENAGVAGARMVDSQPRRPSTPGNDAGSGIMTEVVSCETRFVPLLIGKRGWTIKNIQDESGARVDIDQTVTPRQVRISGSRANVEKAVNMVRDVLSYPHAQLQHGSEELELINHADDAPAVPVSPLKAEVEPSSPTKEQLLAASARLEKDATRKEPESPPPVVGDARSAISASSSLSSTPEPSMASSAKGALASQQLQAQLSGGPLIPPAPQQFSASSTNLSTSVPTFFHQSEMTLKNIRNSEVFGETSGPASTQLYETILSGPLGGMSGRIGVTQGSLPEVAHRQSSHLQPLQDIYASSAPKSVPNQMNPGILPPHQRHYQQPQQPSDQAPSNYGPSGHIPRQMPSQVGGSSQYDYNSGMAQNLRGYPSTTGRSLHSSYSNEAANLIATTPLRDLMGHSMNRGLPSASSAMRSSIYRGNLGSGGAMWNSSNSSYPSGSGGNGGNLRSTGSGLHRAPPPAPSPGYHQSRSAGYSSHQHQLQHQHSHDSGLSGGIGYGSTRSHQSYQQQHTSQLPYSNTRGGLGGGNLHGSPAFPSAPAARSSSLPPPTDDSRMLETLFGTVASAGASNDAGSLLAGLNSLSLGGDTGGETSTGLWGPSSLTDSWTPNAAAGEKQSSSGPSSLGDILSGPLPSLQLDQSQESRFQWK